MVIDRVGTRSSRSSEDYNIGTPSPIHDISTAREGLLRMIARVKLAQIRMATERRPQVP